MTAPRFNTTEKPLPISEILLAMSDMRTANEETLYGYCARSLRVRVFMRWVVYFRTQIALCSAILALTSSKCPPSLYNYELNNQHWSFSHPIVLTRTHPERPRGAFIKSSLALKQRLWCAAAGPRERHWSCKDLCHYPFLKLYSCLKDLVPLSSCN